MQNEEKKIPCNFRMDVEIHAELTRVAYATHLSKTAILEDALRAYLGRGLLENDMAQAFKGLKKGGGLRTLTQEGWRGESSGGTGCGRSSSVERVADTDEVAGSSPAARTNPPIITVHVKKNEAHHVGERFVVGVSRNGMPFGEADLPASPGRSLRRLVVAEND